ncbi:alpha/beta hydrolase [Shewanella sp. C32]|uniref:Alpha/beta hydrolase n=1 Tax=Shewanella electrica TaxID=515560 RepID=A0ABT2FPW2_9GAMM|nr:alpha/beta fold hydrolase [Shewanella electrica]MCH1925879.1 alpha/beta hydrolase [Shewanella electrica]MCS4557236.1 alpha/beta hydrolase [Shewanella electrica]
MTQRYSRWIGLLFGLGLCHALPLPAHAAEQSSKSSSCYAEGLSDQLKCGSVEVAENPKKPNGRKIHIHYVVIPAIKNLAPEEAILGIAGGPGQSAIESAASFERMLSKARQHRDILLIDQRGTGQSNKLACAGEDLTDIIKLNDDAYDSAKETRECKAKLDADVTQYGSEQALGDFEVVRKHLGYQKLHLYGVSYGTRMAQLYMRDYPQVLKTVTLDGVVPMSQSVLAIGGAIARAQELVLEDCEKDPSCQQTYPKLRTEFENVQQSLSEYPVMEKVHHPVSGKTALLTLTRNKFLGSLRLALYSPAVRSLLPFAIHQAYRKNYQPILGLLAMQDGSMDLAMGMHAAVVCGEDWPRLTPALREEAAQSVMGQMMLKAMDESCPIWGIPAVSKAFGAPISSDIPTLLLSGEKDPATPPKWAEMAMQKMTNARHLVSPYATHNVVAQSCGGDLIAKLVETDDVKAIDGECLKKDVRRSFYLNASTVEPLPEEK